MLLSEVIVTKQYEIDDEEIIEAFGSIDKFLEEMEDSDEWYDFMNEADYDREENWISDNKGTLRKAGKLKRKAIKSTQLRCA